jgi:hypothetical protein
MLPPFKPYKKLFYNFGVQRPGCVYYVKLVGEL